MPEYGFSLTRIFPKIMSLYGKIQVRGNPYYGLLYSVNSSVNLNNAKILLNENLTPDNNKIAFYCRKRKREEMISKNYTSNGVNHKSSNSVRNGRALFKLFSHLNFGPKITNNESESNDLANIPIQSSC